MSDGWHDRGARRDGDVGGLVFGLLLILAGGAFLLSNVAGVDLGRWGWPVVVVVPGVVLLVVGLAIRSEGGLGAAIPGGLILSTGLLLAFQDATDTWASWAYAWALIAPGSVGATLFLFGLTHARMDLIDAGLRTAAVGLGLFIGFGLFFENLVGLDAGSGSGSTALRDAMPFLAVAMGVVIVLLNFLPRRDREADTPEQPGTGGASKVRSPTGPT
jgi:hypothetical protein